VKRNEVEIAAGKPECREWGRAKNFKFEIGDFR
jgi:hypothetical protein